MNKYLRSFLYRGLIFGGFGPVVLGIVFLIIELTDVSLRLSGREIFIGIVSTYILAFVQAGVSVFNQIEHWPIAKSLACHFSTLFVIYTLTYIVNSWIPFEPVAILIFCLIFVLFYCAIWLAVYLLTKAYTKRLNEGLKGRD